MEPAEAANCVHQTNRVLHAVLGSFATFPAGSRNGRGLNDLQEGDEWEGDRRDGAGRATPAPGIASGAARAPDPAEDTPEGAAKLDSLAGTLGEDPAANVDHWEAGLHRELEALIVLAGAGDVAQGTWRRV